MQECTFIRSQTIFFFSMVIALCFLFAVQINQLIYELSNKATTLFSILLCFIKLEIFNAFALSFLSILHMSWNTSDKLRKVELDMKRVKQIGLMHKVTYYWMILIKDNHEIACVTKKYQNPVGMRASIKVKKPKKKRRSWKVKRICIFIDL